MKLSFLSLLAVAALTLTGCMGNNPDPPKADSTKRGTDQAAAHHDAHHDHQHDHKHDPKHEEHKHGEHKHGDPAQDAEIKAARDEIEDPADRALVEAQEWCAVMTDNRLGVMGKPYKVMVKDQPVFLCCKSCEKRALADEDKTLATVEELKAKKKAGAPAADPGHHHHHHSHATDAEIKAEREKIEDPEERALVDAQEWCVVMPEERLGAAGPPLKLTIKDQTVFVCCRSCIPKAEADPDKTLATLEELKAKKKAGGGEGK